MAEDGFADVALGDVDVLPALDVADAAAVDGALDRFLDLVLVAAQEAFAVADRFVLAGEATINDVLHEDSAQLLFLTRRYHSQSNRTCFCV